MKKVLIIIFVVFSTVSFAQEFSNKKINFGGRLGINWSSIRGDGSEGLDVKNGGFLLNAFENTSFALRCNLHFAGSSLLV